MVLTERFFKRLFLSLLFVVRNTSNLFKWGWILYFTNLRMGKACFYQNKINNLFTSLSKWKNFTLTLQLLRKYAMTFIKWCKRLIRTQQQTRSGHPLIQKACWESSTQYWLETANDNGVVTTHMPEHHRLTKYIGG